MLRVARDAHVRMLAHALAGLPDEACGLLGADPATGEVRAFVPCRNADASSRTYAIGPDGWAEADRVLDPQGLAVAGVMHSHTHTDPYPSPTDVDRADNPLLLGWHYVIVSLRHAEPATRAYLLDDRRVVEEPILLVD